MTWKKWKELKSRFKETLNLFRGDTNINILIKTSVSKEYINLIQSEGFSQLIFEATRITENSQSCIQIFRLPAQVAALQLRLRIIYQSLLFCMTQNLVPFLIILNSETFGVLKMKISNQIYEERAGILFTNEMKYRISSSISQTRL